MRAAWYNEAVQKLMLDPIVIEMAFELKEHLDRYPEIKFPRDFISATPHVVAREYQRRGGDMTACHLGGPWEALVKLVGENG